ncbi:SPFH domain-containing protein [Saccharicrinis fermentans]|nr:SPFH domain-containing protein [Saccharicrinis fermentans]
MFGINFIKFDAMTHVIQFSNGKIKREGKGLSFYYWAPKTSIAAIPIGSKDIQFIFRETTHDFQKIAIQGQITYVITDPKQLSEVLDFTLVNKQQHKEDNFEKINQRLNNEAQTATAKFIQQLDLKSAIRSAKEIGEMISTGLTNSKAIKHLGVEVINVDVIAVTPTPEMAKALETETREALQKEADQAIYERRNFAVEQERKIRESELNTEIAVQEKEKQIQEKKAQIKIKEQENDRKIRETKIEADVSIEQSKTELTKMRVENMKKEADAKGYLLDKTLSPYKDFDWKMLMAMNAGSMDAKDNIAFAFRELAENSQKIENLNITPDLLQSLLQNK